MTDQSGDRDFVIHGSAPFLGACQSAATHTRNYAPLLSARPYSILMAMKLGHASASLCCLFSTN